MLQLFDHEARHEDLALEEPRKGDVEDAAVDDRARVEKLGGGEPGQRLEGAAQPEQPEDLDVLLGREIGREVARKKVDRHGEIDAHQRDADESDADEGRDDEPDQHTPDGHDHLGSGSAHHDLVHAVEAAPDGARQQDAEGVAEREAGGGEGELPDDLAGLTEVRGIRRGPDALRDLIPGESAEQREQQADRRGEHAPGLAGRAGRAGVRRRWPARGARRQPEAHRRGCSRAPLRGRRWPGLR